MFKKLLKTVISLALAATLGLTGCTNSQPAAGDGPQSSGPLVINLEGGDWGYPTPFSHYSRGPGSFKMALIFDSLLERGEKGYIPWLADKWEVSGDGLTYTFTLKDNVRWQDGRPMTAEDVKFSFDYYAVHPPVSNDLTIDNQSFIQSVEATDAKTVRFKVEKPLAIVLGKIGNTRIIPRHIWESVDDPLKFTAPEAAVGTGPFLLKEYNKEQGAYKFEAFKDFWGPKPLVDTLQFVPVSDPVLAFDKGEIDLTGSITTDILPKYQNSEDYKVLQNPGFWGYRLIFNMEKRPELKDKAVRQAFAYAINRRELVEKVARNAAVPASAGYLPVGHLWYNPAVKDYEFNLEKARQLLAGRTLSVKLLTGNSNEELRIGELLKISLAQAGIELSVTSADTKTRDAAVKKGDYELVLNGHGGWGGDADLLRTSYASKITTSQSPSADGIRGYSNEQLNELCRQQLYELDAEKRKAMVFRIQELIAEEVPQLPLYNTTGYVVFKPAKFDGWKYMFDHHEVTHNKLSYLDVN
ncbi:ABC transporter substrate-binding protein [Desulfosporosinus youngiae]|uniref:ABC-type dipeptide transport system, periplasmic component n=1 Tax=Desulfosporosinus youngiae DSM 17734 TaxID=768710 RepID=H5Y673_9FIRM|nr:ABC transporter substrate-binding protein [Desulfosporosinus youngiae]EHQ91083.1 ABC-type dipeptide transport system, periplasmic component [Desulfosporosinus youngiae DSM 17734]